MRMQPGRAKAQSKAIDGRFTVNSKAGRGRSGCGFDEVVPPVVRSISRARNPTGVGAVGSTVARATSDTFDTDDPFPALSFPTLDHGTVALPEHFAGNWGVLLVYRAHW